MTTQYFTSDQGPASGQLIRNSPETGETCAGSDGRDGHGNRLPGTVSPESVRRSVGAGSSRKQKEEKRRSGIFALTVFIGITVFCDLLFMIVANALIPGDKEFAHHTTAI